MEDWLKDHLNKCDPSPCYTMDNWEPIRLKWEDEVLTEEMPVLRKNWLEDQANYQVYWTQCEIDARNERIRRWANTFTSM